MILYKTNLHSPENLEPVFFHLQQEGITEIIIIALGDDGVYITVGAESGFFIQPVGDIRRIVNLQAEKTSALSGIQQCTSVI